MTDHSDTVRTHSRLNGMEDNITDINTIERSRFATYRDKKRGTPPPPLRPCGTYAAARRHQRKREPLCDACKGAINERQRALYAKRKNK